MVTIRDRVKAFLHPSQAQVETGYYESMYYAKSQQRQYNPDTLVQKKGDLDVYQEMLIDDQVKAVLTMKKNAVLSTGYTIEKASDDKKDVEIADFCEYCLSDGMTGSFRKTALDILSALAYGFSCTEKIYKIFKKGPFPGKLGFSKLKTRPPHSFEFTPDVHGNLEKFIQHGPTGDVELNPAKFVIYSYDSEFGNFYGNSDLRAAYRSWFSKDIVIRFWNIYLERFGMPPVIGRYPRNATPAEQEQVMKIIKNFQAKNAIKLPDDFKIELLEAVRRGEAGYESAVGKHNIMIARAVLLPDLLGYSETKGGAYALGEKHFDVFLWILQSLQADFEETVADDQILKQLVDFNYPNVKEYPKFKFKPLTEKDKHTLMELFIEAADKGIVKPTEDDEDYAREILKFPKRKEEDEPVEPQPAAPQPAQPQPVQDPNQPQPPQPVPSNIPNQVTAFSEKIKLTRKPTKYEMKVNFTAVTTSIEKIESDGMTETGRIITKTKDDLLNWVFRTKIVEEKDFKKVEKMELKYMSEFRLAWKNILRSSFLDGDKHGKSEVGKKSLQETVWGSLPPKEALAYFENKAFYITGTERDKIKRDTKAILYGGIERGETTNEAMFKLEGYFEQYKVEQKTSTGAMKPIEEIPGRLNTLIRTNVNDAYNQGRLTAFRDPDVVDFVIGYQYSAIMDARTSDFCVKYDTRKYKSGNPIWNDITPPNHFSCRSILVPLLTDEDPKFDRVLAIKPDKGFGG